MDPVTLSRSRSRSRAGRRYTGVREQHWTDDDQHRHHQLYGCADHCVSSSLPATQPTEASSATVSARQNDTRAIARRLATEYARLNALRARIVDSGVCRRSDMVNPI